MAGGADELLLLERVFLRVGSADSDDQLQNVVAKFLPPVLLKLASQQEGVRKKVMELLVHINKRVKSRPLVQLPVEALLVQYQDPAASSFVINFTIIYIKMGFPRLPIAKQAELVPSMLNALESKPQSHQDSLLLLIIPLLGNVEVPSDPVKRVSLFGLNEKPQIAKQLITLLLDVLLLPYGALAQQPSDTSQPTTSDVSLPVPPGMSEFSYKRITNDNFWRPEELEQIKLGIVKFLALGVFHDQDILLPLIVAAADTRFSVANLADLELKKVIGMIDWSSSVMAMPLYLLYLGSQAPTVKPEMKKSPASTRIRLKLITYLCRVSGSAFVIPAAVQLVFDTLYGTNTNTRLKTMVLTFTGNIVQQAEETALSRVSVVLMMGLLKLIKEGEPVHQGQSYLIIGKLGCRFPNLVYKDIEMLKNFFGELETASPDMRMQIRESLLSLCASFKYDSSSEAAAAKEDRLNSLMELLSGLIKSNEHIVRFVAVRYVATIFPPEHVSSKVLLLLATGDNKDDVFMEALKALYGTSRRNDTNVLLRKDASAAAATDDKECNKIVMPPFAKITECVYNESRSRMLDNNLKYNVGNLVLPYAPNVYTEILIYIRLCLTQSLSVPLTRETIRHPSELTPIVGKYLNALYKNKDPIEKNPVLQYLHLIRQLLIASPSIEPLCCMLELVGCIPKLHSTLSNNVQWIRDMLGSTKEEIREHAATLYAIVASHGFDDKTYDGAVSSLIDLTKDKSLELQHGAVLAIANALERKITSKKIKYEKVNDWNLFERAVACILPCLSNSSSMIVNAGCVSVGLLGRACGLPLEDGQLSGKESPNAKRPANAKFTKIQVVEKLFEIMNNSKLPSKTRERAAKSLGLICVGEAFPHTKEILQGLLDTAKDTKDVEVHFTVGESLVMCIESIWSQEARDPWTVLPDEYTPEATMQESPSDDLLEWLIEQLLKNVSLPHPHSRQAFSIWLLAVLKHCPNRAPVTSRLALIQQSFMDLLSDNNDIVQDVASKGLVLVFESSDSNTSSALLNQLVDQLTVGRRKVVQVTSDTKLFEEGQLGKSPTGGNLSTYKELCSLASDMNKPDLIYKFMHLANHNAMWTSKKGAAFGFSTIAQKAGEQLKPHLPTIVPKLYRYQFDPTPNIQDSMKNIWHVLVPETQKTLDLYYDEILADLLQNLVSPQWRVRQSCCVALQDFFRSTGKKTIHDCVDSIPEIWTQLFRVMDDYHEGTRYAATNTAKILSKICIRACDAGQGKDGAKMMDQLLPILLQTGITNTVAEVRAISLKTVAQLVDSAGNLLKPFLPLLIPALLQATGELESNKLSHLSTMFGGQSQTQEVIDSVRASAAKSHFTTETMTKCLQYADASILEELVPKVVDLMKNSVGLGTRVACAHFITMLSLQVGQDLQPYTGKFLATLVNGLTDRNAAVRKHYATAIGHLVKTAKDSSLEKLFQKLKLWYFEREDDSIRSAIAYTIQSIGNQNQEILKNYSDVVLPWVFFAMHAEKKPETEATLEVWKDIWSENSPGTETGIRQNTGAIIDIIKEALESPSWTMKSQAANAVGTVALKLGADMETNDRNTLISILLTGLSGRTWNGKENLLKALSSICKNCSASLKEDTNFDSKDIVEAVMKEARKDEIVYKRHALESLGEILISLNLDRFEDVHNIVQSVLMRNVNVVDSDDDGGSSSNTKEETSKKQENLIKLRETTYETLGKAWPSKGVATQEKYRQQFVEHCVSCLPESTRSVQVCMMVALCQYVDKLELLSAAVLEKKDQEILAKILEDIYKALKYALGISKHTRLRKEALNVIISLIKKLKDKNGSNEFNKLKLMFEEILPELMNDNQPEVKSRMVDIKDLLKPV